MRNEGVGFVQQYLTRPVMAGVRVVARSVAFAAVSSGRATAFLGRVLWRLLRAVCRDLKVPLQAVRPVLFVWLVEFVAGTVPIWVPLVDGRSIMLDVLKQGGWIVTGVVIVLLAGVAIYRKDAPGASPLRKRGAQVVLASSMLGTIAGIAMYQRAIELVGQKTHVVTFAYSCFMLTAAVVLSMCASVLAHMNRETRQ